MFVDVVAGLPTGMDFRGSCPERLIVFLIRVGVAHLRPPCLQMCSTSIVAVRIHYHSETAEEPV